MKQIKEKMKRLMQFAKKYRWLGGVAGTMWWVGIYSHEAWLLVLKAMA